MYKAYVKEKGNLDTYETEYGFGAYTINKIEKSMDIGDFYIKPEYRNGKYSTRLFSELKEIAKDKDCKKIICNADLTHINPEESIYAIIRHGFKYSHFFNQVIYFYMEI